VLPVCPRHGVGALVWTPLAHGLLTGRLRRGAQADIRRAEFGSTYLRDERRLDAVERLVGTTDHVLDRIDAIVSPGADLDALDMAFQPPAVQKSGLRRGSPADRSPADRSAT